MKKNVLLIVLDSITNDVLFNEVSSKIKAPFLYELRKKSISGDSMYSEAPYTEAALKALLGSVDTMDYNGYIEKYKDTYLVMEEFQKNGYYVFSNAYYPNIYPKYLIKGVNEKKYCEAYTFYYLWEYRFQYYQKLYLDKKTTNSENKMLIDMLENNIEAWILYLKKIECNDEETSFINECVNKKYIERDILKLELELKKFKKDKNKYLNDYMKLGENHILFSFNNYKYEDKLHDESYRAYFKKKIRKTLNKIYFTNLKYNAKNNKFPLKQIIYFFKTCNKKSLKGTLAGYKNSLFDKDLHEWSRSDFDLIKSQRSFKYVSHVFKKWVSNNKNIPWFSYIHIDDAHYPESFLSYDISNRENLDKELCNINNYISKLPHNYKGSLAYDLSLLYCDNVIKEIFEFLESKNILKNTIVIITADHGYSYSFCPPREKYVLSNYKENYNVPYIVYDYDRKGSMIKGFRTTKDIPATLLDIVGIKKPKIFKGNSLLKNTKQDYVTIEYMGGGCPDITRRPINLGIRTKNYLVVMDVYLYEKFEKSIIKEVYDLNNDEFEKYNIVNKIDALKINYEISLIKKRYIQLRGEYHYDKD